MLIVLDSNEYIFAFGPSKEPSIKLLFDRLLNQPKVHTIRVPRTIFEEVKRNLSLEAFQEFNIFIGKLTNVDEDILVPFELGLKYETLGLKSSDAFIAADTEWVGADTLVTENRHFLSRSPDLPFKVLTVENCLKILGK